MWSAIVAFLCAALLTFGGLSLRLSIGVYVLWGLLVWFCQNPKWEMGALLGIAFVLRIYWMEPSLATIYFAMSGRGTAAGGNPYLTPPSDLSLWTQTFIHRSTTDIPSIYPSCCDGSLCAGIECLVYNQCHERFFLVVDIGCVWMLCRIGLKRRLGLVPAWLYALHPLAIVELSGSGHMDGLGLFCLLCAFWAVEHQRTSAFWLLMGGGVKLLPAVLLPRVFSIKDSGMWLGLAVLFLLTLPFIQDPSALLTALSTYAQHWSFNGSVFAVLFPVLGIWTRPILAGAGLLILGSGFEKCSNCAAWPCGFAGRVSCFRRQCILGMCSGLGFQPYCVTIGHGRRWRPWCLKLCQALLTLDENMGQWAPPLWPSLVIYGIFGGVAAAHFLQSRQVKTA